VLNVTVHGSKDCIVFCNITKFFYRLRSAWWNFAWAYTLSTARTLLDFKVIGQSSRSQDQILDTLPLWHKGLTAISFYQAGPTRSTVIGQRWHHCYKYCSMQQWLQWTALALCVTWQLSWLTWFLTFTGDLADSQWRLGQKTILAYRSTSCPRHSHLSLGLSHLGTYAHTQ